MKRLKELYDFWIQIVKYLYNAHLLPVKRNSMNTMRGQLTINIPTLVHNENRKGSIFGGELLSYGLIQIKRLSGRILNFNNTIIVI